MNAYEFLLLVHVGGAIVGFGPAFGTLVSGSLASKLSGPASGGILSGAVAIQRRLLLPVTVVTQPLSGVLLIFKSGRGRDFLSHEWLVASIAIYATVFLLAVLVQTPTLQKMIDLSHAGMWEAPEVEALRKRAMRTGWAVALGIAVVTFLMIVKPDI